MGTYDPAQRAVESYELAYERAVLARKEWADAGRPFVIEHANRMIGALAESLLAALEDDPDEATVATPDDGNEIVPYRDLANPHG